MTVKRDKRGRFLPDTECIRFIVAVWNSGVTKVDIARLLGKDERHAWRRRSAAFPNVRSTCLPTYPRGDGE